MARDKDGGGDLGYWVWTVRSMGLYLDWPYAVAEVWVIYLT